MTLSDGLDQTQGTDRGVARLPELFVLWEHPFRWLFLDRSTSSRCQACWSSSKGKGQAWKNRVILSLWSQSIYSLIFPPIHWLMLIYWCIHQPLIRTARVRPLWFGVPKVQPHFTARFSHKHEFIDFSSMPVGFCYGNMLKCLCLFRFLGECRLALRDVLNSPSLAATFTVSLLDTKRNNTGVSMNASRLIYRLIVSGSKS